MDSDRYLSMRLSLPVRGTNPRSHVHFPDDLNLADFKSAAIWCRQFNATFGAAALKP